MVLHWQGGDHTALTLKMNTAGKHRWTVSEDTLTLVRQLARQMPDKQIARLLNRAGKPTGRGNGWTETRVRSFLITKLQSTAKARRRSGVKSRAVQRSLLNVIASIDLRPPKAAARRSCGVVSV